MATFMTLLERTNRPSVRRERIFRDRNNVLDTLNDDELISRYRFPGHIIMEMVDGVKRQLQPITQRSHSIPSHKQVLATLRYLSKGDFFSEVADLHGISKTSVSVCFPNVCEALCQFLDIIKFPTTVTEVRKIKEGFHAIDNFLNVIGAIDGTLIPIQGMSGDDEPVYVCRKNFHAINVQGVVDADLRFLSINCRFPGATHDAYVLMNSSVPEIVQQLPEDGWLLGDSGYPLKDYLMTPFSNPTTNAQKNYNFAHCKTRNVIQRAFGVLKSRFRCLDKSGGYLSFKPLKCAKVIETCMRLHNKAIMEKIPLRQGGQIHNLQHNHSFQGQASGSAQQIRDQIASRF